MRNGEARGSGFTASPIDMQSLGHIRSVGVRNGGGRQDMGVSEEGTGSWFQQAPLPRNLSWRTD